LAGNEERGQYDGIGPDLHGKLEHLADGLVPVNVRAHGASRAPSLTWADEAAVAAHESGAAFEQYKQALRPLVEPDSVLFGNTLPIKVLGYGPLPEAAGGDPTRSA
jgi:hypothetical protein